MCELVPVIRYEDVSMHDFKCQIEPVLKNYDLMNDEQLLQITNSILLNQCKILKIF